MEKNKVMALLSYIGILVLVPIFAAKTSPYARFHANQGLVLFLISAVNSFVIDGLLGGIGLFHFISWLIGLCCLGLAIIGIINAVNGRAKELPLVGKFQLIK